MVTRLTNNTIDSNTLMSTNFQIEQLEDYHLVPNLYSNIVSANNNSWVNSNDFSTYSTIVNFLNSVEGNIYSILGYQTSNVVKDSNTNIAVGTSNVFFLGNTALSDSHIDVFLDGYFQSNNYWLYNTNNNSIQFLAPEIPETSRIDISFFVEETNPKLDSDLIHIQSKKITKKNYDLYPNYSINFEKVDNADKLVTTVQSNETYTINNKRQLEKLNSNTTRVYHKSNTGIRLGILSEPQRANFLVNAQNPSDNSTVYKTQAGTLTSNVGEAPDGSNSAFAFTPSSSTGQHYWNIFQDYLPDADSNPHTFQIFCKAAGYNTIGVKIGNTFSSYIRATANLANGNISDTNVGNATLEEYSNGWFLFTLYSDKTSYTTDVDTLLINPVEDGEVMGTSYQGDGSSSMWFWRPQLELADIKSLPIIYSQDTDNSNIQADNVYINFLSNVSTKESTYRFKSYKIDNNSNLNIGALTNNSFSQLLSVNIIGNVNILSSYLTSYSIDENEEVIANTQNTNVIFSTTLAQSGNVNYFKASGPIVIQGIDVFNKNLSNSNLHIITVT